jgi:hypothetical protein
MLFDYETTYGVFGVARFAGRCEARAHRAGLSALLLVLSRNARATAGCRFYA